jgi:hypothetical protein
MCPTASALTRRACQVPGACRQPIWVGPGQAAEGDQGQSSHINPFNKTNHAASRATPHWPARHCVSIVIATHCAAIWDCRGDDKVCLCLLCGGAVTVHNAMHKNVIFADKPLKNRSFLQFEKKMKKVKLVC